MSRTPQQLALALEAVFKSLAEIPTEELQDGLMNINPALVDQSQAARKEAERLAPLLYGGTGETLQRETTAPEWARLGALEALSFWFLPDSPTCTHKPRPERPQPVYACAWKPGMVVCAHCVHLLSAATPEADATCDGCGHRCAGVAGGDPIYPTMLMIGTLTFLFGLCGTCWADTNTEESSSK